MVARGSDAPPSTRGLPCSKCGGDDWRYRSDKGTWYCRPCATARDRDGQRRRRGAEPLGEMLHQARARARRSGLPFGLTLESLRAVWPHDGRCPVLGIRLKRGQGKMGDASPTLDRLNPVWGYEPGNVAVISLRANRAKNNCTAEELDRIAAWMRRCGME